MRVQCPALAPFATAAASISSNWRFSSFSDRHGENCLMRRRWTSASPSGSAGFFWVASAKVRIGTTKESFFSCWLNVEDRKPTLRSVDPAVVANTSASGASASHATRRSPAASPSVLCSAARPMPVPPYAMESVSSSSSYSIDTPEEPAEEAQRRNTRKGSSVERDIVAFLCILFWVLKTIYKSTDF
jgi:hypothetical protein